MHSATYLGPYAFTAKRRRIIPTRRSIRNGARGQLHLFYWKLALPVSIGLSCTSVGRRCRSERSWIDAGIRY